ncbi:MAG: type VI secretion system ATPase TssH, partial [Acidobacteria bacterium]|nr:type VI secretion system ATPase TssH [Acidobacteriota bacterium]
MQFDKLTQKAQEACLHGRDRAAHAGHPEVTPEHLLLALLDQEESIVLPLLARLGVAVEPLRADLGSELERRPRTQGGAEPGMSSGVARLLEDARKAASQFKDDYISTEHLLLALAR